MRASDCSTTQTLQQATHVRAIVILPVQLAGMEVSNKLLQLARDPGRVGR